MALLPQGDMTCPETEVIVVVGLFGHVDDREWRHELACHQLVCRFATC